MIKVQISATYYLQSMTVLLLRHMEGTNQGYISSFYEIMNKHFWCTDHSMLSGWPRIKTLYWCTVTAIPIATDSRAMS